MTAQELFVIVGAGLTGPKAAETLRTEGFDGRIVRVGEEAERVARPAGLGVALEDLTGASQTEGQSR